MTTKKQKDARIKNFNKGCLMGMRNNLIRICLSNNISDEVVEYLRAASQLINNALKEWDKLNEKP